MQFQLSVRPKDKREFSEEVGIGVTAPGVAVAIAPINSGRSGAGLVGAREYSVLPPSRNWWRYGDYLAWRRALRILASLQKGALTRLAVEQALIPTEVI